MQLIVQPWSEKSLGDVLQSALNGEIGAFEHFDAAVAFVKRSGVQHIADSIREFVGKHDGVRIVAGIDQHGTSIEGLRDLLEAVGDHGSIWLVHDSNSYVTFHPKLYLFRGGDEALLIVGSGNLTQGGLYTNDEVSVVCSLDLHRPDDLDILRQVETAFDRWCDTAYGTAHLLDAKLLQALIENDDIRSEAQTRTEGDIGVHDDRPERADGLFGSRPDRRRPGRYRRQAPSRGIETPPSGQAEPEPVASLGFVMTLMRTDVGVGQTTPGTARRSPEVFVPLAARDAQPGFWGWQELFIEDPNKPGKWDRKSVPMKIGAEIIHVNMMTWPDKHDFRLRSEALRSAGTVGDILRIEQSNDSSHRYTVDVIRQDTDEYQHFLQWCVSPVPGGSLRKWGYYTFGD